MILSKSLKLDLPALAEMIRSKGRGKDTMLAHITPKEAALLKRRGGSGSVNPDTGLPEYEDSGDYDFGAPAPVSPYTETISTPADSGGYGINYGAPAAQPSYSDTSVPGYTPGAYADYAASQTAPLSTYGQLQPGISPTGPVQVPLVQAPQVGFDGAPQAAAKPDQSLLTKAGDYLSSEKGLGTLARLGLAGGLGVFGAGQAKKAAGQTQAATAQQQAIAQPYTEQGKQLVAQAQRGELTPQSQQALEAAKAQIAQSTATRGGVGQQQAANQIANLYQTLLNNQYTYGLNVMNIGDQISLGAIRSGLQLDQQLQQSTNNFYTQLASLAAGGTGQQPQTVRVVQ
jgi:hypothetical protein